MGFEMLFILGLALLIFGPKKLPQISRQVGKILAEFRHASQEFKSQIEEEVRNLEIQVERERREAQTKAGAESQTHTQPQILPPSVGETVSMRREGSRDSSFDSANPSEPTEYVVPDSSSEANSHPADENPEAMKGQNA